MAGGQEGFARLSAAHPEVTAVFCFNDLVAVGADRAARRLGPAIAGEVARAGYAGLPLGKLLDPPLTTASVSPGVPRPFAMRRPYLPPAAADGRLRRIVPPRPAGRCDRPDGAFWNARVRPG